MMKPAYTFLVALALLLPLAEVAHSQGLLSKFRRPPEKVPTEQELADSEGLGSATFRKAEAFEAEGRTSKAQDLYRSIAKTYPNTRVGAEAQYRVALIDDKDGNGRKAFTEYQTLISKYRTSPHYQTAIERQFAIASALKQDGHKGVLGIGASVQPSELKKMFQDIADSSPYSHFAPKSLMALAEIDLADGGKAEALRNYQLVVDNYRGTQFASDAQFEIYKLRGESAAASNSASEDRAQVDAGLDFVSQNPTDPRSEMVKNGLEDIENRTLEKHYKAAQFYDHAGKYTSAMVYYREIAKKPQCPHYQAVIARMTELERIIAQGGTEEKEKGAFGHLPSLKLEIPKIEIPKIRLGKKGEKGEPVPQAQAVPELPAN